MLSAYHLTIATIVFLPGEKLFPLPTGRRASLASLSKRAVAAFCSRWHIVVLTGIVIHSVAKAITLLNVSAVHFVSCRTDGLDSDTRETFPGQALQDLRLRASQY
jgi:hypothetical protein